MDGTFSSSPPIFDQVYIGNIILVGAWSGPSKPSRTEMNIFFQPLVDELATLEEGVTFDLHDEDNASIIVHVFLLGAGCDKPVQILLQFFTRANRCFWMHRL